jgi:hypothetical protein
MTTPAIQQIELQLLGSRIGLVNIVERSTSQAYTLPPRRRVGNTRLMCLNALHTLSPTLVSPRRRVSPSADLSWIDGIRITINLMFRYVVVLVILLLVESILQRHRKKLAVANPRSASRSSSPSRPRSTTGARLNLTHVGVNPSTTRFRFIHLDSTRWDNQGRTILQSSCVYT